MSEYDPIAGYQYVCPKCEPVYYGPVRLAKAAAERDRDERHECDAGYIRDVQTVEGAEVPQ
jgi:hypothetical protein